MRSPLEGVVAKCFDGPANLPFAYRRLFDRAAAGNPFLSLDWFLNFEAHVVEPPRKTLVYGVEGAVGGQPLGALVMWRYVCRDWPLKLRRLESLGNYYTPLFAPIVAADAPDLVGVCRALASALWRDRHSWDVLYLQPMEHASPSVSALARGLRDSGLIVQDYFCFGNWYLDVAGRSYEEYVRDLPGVLRKNLAYQARRMERAWKVVYRLVTDEDGLDTALDDYERVYRATWKRPEPHPRFVRQLADVAARNGWLRLGLVYLNGEPAAAQLWLVSQGVASIYKICYDDRFAKYSVGTVLTGRVLQHVIDVDKAHEVDYLGGDDPYKRNWMSHRRERWGIRAFNPRSVGGVLGAAKYVGGRLGKRTLSAVGRLGTRRRAGSRGTEGPDDA